MIEKAKVTLEVTAKITDEFIEFQSEAIGTAFGRWGYKKLDIEKALIELEAYKGTALTPEQIQKLKERDTTKAPEESPDAFGDTILICPNCRNSVINYFNRRRPPQFCMICGQRLRWEEWR